MIKLRLALLCPLLLAVHCLPQPEVTQIPKHTRAALEQFKQLESRAYVTSQFRPTIASYEQEDDDNYDDNKPEPSQDRQPTYANQNYPVRAPVVAGKQAYPVKVERRPQPQQQYRRGEAIGKETLNNKLEEKEEIEEPDRLTELLPQSKFTCNGRNTGYYADENLGCEVFHYCQDNARHSWICPEGFTFHQVHLICMPPGGDNICEKSSDFHFVNDFLYKPLNLEEFQQKPNVTLRYSDRYYPDIYRPKYEDDEEDERPVQRPHQHSVRVPVQQRIQSTTFRPQTSIGQVFRSPEEINISLQQRRPPQYSTAKYTVDY